MTILCLKTQNNITTLLQCNCINILSLKCLCKISKNHIKNFGAPSVCGFHNFHLSLALNVRSSWVVRPTWLVHPEIIPTRTHKVSWYYYSLNWSVVSHLQVASRYSEKTENGANCYVEMTMQFRKQKSIVLFVYISAYKLVDPFETSRIEIAGTLQFSIK